MRWSIVSSRLTSTTCPLPAVQRHHGGEGGGEARRLVGERHRRQERLAVGLAVDRREPAHRLGDRREPRPPGVRAVLAEPGDAGDHEPSGCGDAARRAEPELAPAAGPEVLDQDATRRRRGGAGLAVGIVLEVEHDRALAAVGELAPQAGAVARVAPGHRAQAVAVGVLDLDDVGAEVGQVAGAVRAGDHGRQVDDAEIGERTTPVRWCTLTSATDVRCTMTEDRA